MADYRLPLDEAAEREYFRDDDELYWLCARLRRTGRPAARARMLMRRGDIEWHRAGLHAAAFGPGLDEDGCPAAEWLGDSARLLWVLGEAERARGRRARWPASQGYSDRVDDRLLELANAAGHLLDEFAAGGRRRPLLTRMVAVWEPVARGQAVESVAGLSWPWWCR